MSSTPEKDLLFCSNCKTLGSLKYVGNKVDGMYLCRRCWNEYDIVKAKMKRSIKPDHYPYWSTWGCEG